MRTFSLFAVASVASALKMKTPAGETANEAQDFGFMGEGDLPGKQTKMLHKQTSKNEV